MAAAGRATASRSEAALANCRGASLREGVGNILMLVALASSLAGPYRVLGKAAAADADSLAEKVPLQIHVV